MKCEHGNEVRVIIETNDPYCWDDGIRQVDKEGQQDYGGDYLSIEGCDECKVIRMERVR